MLCASLDCLLLISWAIIFSSQGTVLLHSIAQAIAELPCPVVAKSLQEFLGMVHFYNCFLPHVATYCNHFMVLQKAKDQVNSNPEQIKVLIWACPG